ncbi:phosphotransferase enzyme family protein [Ekhidna sp.]
MGIVFDEIIKHFDINGEIAHVSPHGNGLINKTFRLHNKQANAPDYLMQRINGDVFHDIAGMTSNLLLITTHLKNKEVGNNSFVSLTPVATHSGEFLFKSNDDHFWRIFLFLKDLISFDKALNIEYVYEGAKGYGQFIKEMNDFPVEKLHVVIPDFHHLGKRLEQLNSAKERANLERISKCSSLFEVAELQYDRLKEMITSVNENLLPIRVTHNDTKFNNILFDSNGKSACVVDLDTAMPGIVHYDFGDGMRTGAVECAEDENDFNKITLKGDKIKAYCEGYLNPISDLLTSIELKFLPLAPSYMALIMSVRFLTDYLNNDNYYRIEYPEQNYMRARCQLKLSELFYEQREFIEDIIST